MLNHTRRRALGLLIAAGIGARIISVGPRAFAQEEEPEDVGETGEEETEEPEELECYDSKNFGAWKGEASDASAGAGIEEAPVRNPEACDLSMSFQVNTDFESRVFVTGSEEGTPLPDDFLIKPENRLIAKTADGKEAVNVQLCGNCTDIYDNAVNIVLPLAVSPLLREEDTIEIALRLDGKDDDCRFEIDCVTMRKALDWAEARRDELAKERDDNTCVSPEGCFITTACCEVLGLEDDCFELRALRRYRDDVLAKQPGGQAAIADYYALAPRILARLPAQSRKYRLLSAYARFILPAAVSARLGFNALAYRLYTRMLRSLATDTATGASCRSRPSL